jgi:hypothetical protein
VVGEVSGAVGSRGGNVRDLDTARDLQAQVKAKRDWSGAIDEQIRLKLVGTATVHANDLDGLDVPAAHRNLIGTRMARYCNKGWMEPTTERRKVTHPAANGRKNPVYRITRKGWRELTVGVGIYGGALEEADGDQPVSSPVRPPTVGVDPGEPQSPTGAPSPKGPGGGTNKPDSNRCASATTGESPAVTSQAAGDSARPYEVLSLLPDVDPESWAA